MVQQFRANMVFDKRHVKKSTHFRVPPSQHQHRHTFTEFRFNRDQVRRSETYAVQSGFFLAKKETLHLTDDQQRQERRQIQRQNRPQIQDPADSNNVECRGIAVGRKYKNMNEFLSSLFQSESVVNRREPLQSKNLMKPSTA